MDQQLEAMEGGLASDSLKGWPRILPLTVYIL